MDRNMKVMTVRGESAFSRLLRFLLSVAAVALAVYGIYKLVDRYSSKRKAVSSSDDGYEDEDDSEENDGEDNEGVEMTADDVLNEAESDTYDDAEPIEVPEMGGQNATEA